MRHLTKAQEEIMQLIWDIGECTVGDLRNEIEKRTGKKPPHSTVSAIVLALDKHAFLTHKTYGRTFVYQAAMTREQYGRRSLKDLITDYFGGSPNRLVAHLAKRENLDIDEVTDLLRKLEEE
ncbi:MAG: BlaI/MecI/CopY family transcriptional regulator [Saprospiraceae bacterium]